MSGRRVYRRFSHQAPSGQMRISRDVEVDVERTSPEIFVLSDAAAAVGELLTLAVVSSTGEVEVEVRVADSRPHFSDGVMRHRLRLEIVTPPFPRPNATPEPQR